ncbi:MAG: hypothetical protein IKA41_08930 [Bacteroidaceae bacterium]|nr:hypothetical protein [Bacteroidaceae bacterium]
MNTEEIHQRKLLALRLHAKTKNKYVPHCDIPTFSFEELGVVFQAPIAMDLRNAGICVLSTTSKDRLPGLRMREEFVGMTITQFIKELNRKNLI